MTARLSDLEIQRALGSLPGWSRRGTALTKTYAWPTCARGIEFVNRVAKAADAANHHPDIDIRYSKVTCTLSTHDAGGITEKDLELAGEPGGAPTLPVLSVHGDRFTAGFGKHLRPEARSLPMTDNR
jgi:4a-hydroxytetrahydrobiopterin dehydratase